MVIGPTGWRYCPVINLVEEVVSGSLGGNATTLNLPMEGMTVWGRDSRLTTPVQTAHVSIMLPVCVRPIAQFL